MRRFSMRKNAEPSNLCARRQNACAMPRMLLAELIKRHQLDEKAHEGGMSDNLTEFLLIALQAHKQGHEGARCNLHPADCPFEYGSVHEVAWRNGWCDASLGVDFGRGAAEFQNMAKEEAA